MELNLFVYVLLIFCIPYLSYSNFRIKPRKGFSILFISIISSVILLNFSLLTVLGTLLLIVTLLINNKKIYPYFYGSSFILLNFTIFEKLNLSTLDVVFNYLFPISLVSGVFSSMMIGHWFLVDPTINREGMKNIAKFSMYLSFLLSLSVLINFYESSTVFFNIVGNELLNNVIVFLFISAGILSYASFKSLQEKSYTGVMASTGLSYLSLIVSLGASGTLILSL